MSHLKNRRHYLLLRRRLTRQLLLLTLQPLFQQLLEQQRKPYGCQRFALSILSILQLALRY